MRRVCSDCGKEMRKIDVEVEEAKTKGVGWECSSCGNLEFEKASSKKILNELKAKKPIHLSLRVIKLPSGQLGIYFDDKILEHFRLTPGEKVEAEINRKSMLLKKG